MGRKKIAKYAFSNKESLLERLKDAFKLFELEGAATALEDVNKNATRDRLTYFQFLERLLEEEMNRKEDLRIERWIKQAKFPWIGTIEKYDFKWPDEIDKDNILKLANCSWIENGGKVIFFGPTGVGKTHLSIALGMKAIEKNYQVKFMTYNMFKQDIARAVAKDTESGSSINRKKLLDLMVHVPLLIIDEMGYNDISPEVGDLIFQIIHSRHVEQKSIIMTANETFDKWDRFFGWNKERAAAAIDRLLEDCAVLSIKGRSYRQKHMIMSGTTKNLSLQK